MDKEQPLEEIDDHQDQTEAIEPEVSDVDLNHVRGLMYTLVTICVFCASILLGPDQQILPADGEMNLPVVDLKISQGSFLYFGPIIIICVSMYTYLFLLKILARIRAGCEYSDQYIFTMKNPAAQVATYGIFFWLPALVLFAFAYKALPRPESANLIGVSLIFLITIVSIQLLLRIYQFNFLGVVAGSFFCVALVLYGFVENREWLIIGDKGLLSWVRLELNTLRSMSLDKVVLKDRDLREIEIRNAQAESIVLNGSDLRGAVIKDAYLKKANLTGADLRETKLICTNLREAVLDDADLRDAELLITNFKRATFRRTDLRGVNFHVAAARLSCDGKGRSLDHTNLGSADFEGADLSRANLSKVYLSHAKLNGAKLVSAKIIDATVTASYFLDKTDLSKVDLRCSYLNRSRMDGAILIRAKLGGTDFTGAILTNADLTEATFDALSCSKSCIDLYIDKKNCIGKEGENTQEGCDCEPGKKGLRVAKLVGTNLAFANLQESSLVGVDLTKADLRGANLHEANLSGANLKDTDLMFAKLIETKELTCDQLKEAKNWESSIRDKKLECNQPVLNFEGLNENLKKEDKKKTLADFHRVVEEFARSSRERQINTYHKMEGAMMSGVNLRNLNLESLFLNKAKLNQTVLRGTNLKRARLWKAELKKADLRRADLRGAFLNMANFEGAYLQEADLEGAELKGTILLDANLEGANLNDVNGLTCPQLQSAKNWKQSYRDDDFSCGGAFPTKPNPNKKKAFQ